MRRIAAIALLAVMAFNFALEMAMVLRPTLPELQRLVAGLSGEATPAQASGCCSGSRKAAAPKAVDSCCSGKPQASCCAPKTDESATCRTEKPTAVSSYCATKSAEAPSCCESKPIAAKRASSHSCPCCGPNCPMGDACTCGHPARSSPGFYCLAPSCHPSADLSESGFVPPSLAFQFLPGDACATPIVRIRLLRTQQDSLIFRSHCAAPPSPPPERVGWLSPA
jgi:hypothetical protein